MWTWLSEPFAPEFMRMALYAVIITASGCAALGVQVVLRRMAFMGDAMAHATLPGVVMAFILSTHLLLGALAAALLAALGIAWVSRHQRVSEDSAIGILYTAMFAVGVIILQRVGTYRDLAHVLVGNPMGVDNASLVYMSVVVAGVLVTLLLLRRQLAVTLIDPHYAASLGISPHRMRAVVLVLCAAMVVAAMTLVGVILTAALIITPAAAARLICRSLWSTTLVSMGIAVFGCVAGIIIAYHADLAMGATMVVMVSVVFALVWGVSCIPLPRRSLTPSEGANTAPP
ncbi:MAG: metal ABC transporter permease [Planctomycetota bacterium]|nr:MAG: metal ABC transporter permease [Planctomycetota bacterium]